MEHPFRQGVGTGTVQASHDANKNSNITGTSGSRNNNDDSSNRSSSSRSGNMIIISNNKDISTTTTDKHNDNDSSSIHNANPGAGENVLRFQCLASTASAVCGGKYQLRPRSLQARRRSDSEWSLPDTLRHKPRPPPLSRYRRKTANARERYRMRQINTAFESLRGVLPSWVCSRRAAADMTKITTLRLASAYIRSLQDILDGNAAEDTCSWVLSSILGEATNTPGSQPEPNAQHTPATTQDSDIVSLLCSSSDTGVFQDSLDCLSYMSPMSETEAVALLLGSDPPRGWSDAHHTQLVT